MKEISFSTKLHVFFPGSLFLIFLCHGEKCYPQFAALFLAFYYLRLIRVLFFLSSVDPHRLAVIPFNSVPRMLLRLLYDPNRLFNNFYYRRAINYFCITKRLMAKSKTTCLKMGLKVHQARNRLIN